MFQRIMHVFLGLIVIALLNVSNVWAVTFGKMDIASHMGEPFYVEVPIYLDADESLAKTAVELGTVSDYRILEVYRDATINKIRADIVDDERGSRVALSSEAAIDIAFFNVILKVRYGRATHYKKLPIFLGMARAGARTRAEAPKVDHMPAINSARVVPETSNAFIAKSPVDLMNPLEGVVEEQEEILVVAEEEAPESKVFSAYDSWARSARYGPMVYGDTITTVAQRLRLDNTFTNQQVMMALYEKNRSQFSKDNINLIKAGAYLDVPTSEEVRSMTAGQAANALFEQSKAWKSLVSQPKFAAVAEAQRTRYMPRVRIGQQATGTAKAPVVPMPAAALSPNTLRKAEAVEQPALVATKVDRVAKARLAKAQAAALKAKKVFDEALAEKDAQLLALQQKMALIEKKMTAAEKKAAAAPKPIALAKQAAPSGAISPDAAAMLSQNQRLEILVARLTHERDQAKLVADKDQGAAGWMLYAVIGLGLLVVLLLVGVAMLMRKERTHPADEDQTDQNMMSDADNASGDTLETETPDGDDVSTLEINVDDFEMPAEAVYGDSAPIEEGSLDMLDDPLDAPMEEMPELTDDDTKEIEAFHSDGDEVADPSVNYLEEADVYLRYGMEDEAAKQVDFALKLNPDDPLAHAKLVQILRAKGDDSAEDTAMTAAKAVLAGAALVTFEKALMGELTGEVPVKDESVSEDGMVSTADDMEPFAASPMDPAHDDTGAIDFGEFSLTPESDTKDADLSDTGDIDFGDLGEGASDLSTEDSQSSDGIDFGDIDFGSLGDTDDATTEVEKAETSAAVSESADDAGLDFDFSAMGKDESDSVVSDAADNDQGISDDSIALEGLSFDPTEEVKVTADDDEHDASLVFEGLNFDPTEEVKVDAEETGLDSLESLVIDFDELDMPSMDESDGLVSADQAVLEETDSDLTKDGNASIDNDGLDSLDIDFGELDMPSMDESDGLVSADQAVLEETDSDLTKDANASIDNDSLDSLGIDFGDLDIPNMSDTDSVESADETGIDVDFGVLGSLEDDDFDMDSTAAIAIGDETMVVSGEQADLEPEGTLNDRQKDEALRLEEEKENAVSVAVDTSSDDPFAAASASLMDVESDHVTEDLTSDDFGSLLGEDLDTLSLDVGSVQDEDLSMSDMDETPLIDQPVAGLDSDLSEDESDPVKEPIESNAVEEAMDAVPVLDDSLSLDDFDMDSFDFDTNETSDSEESLKPAVDSSSSALDDLEATVILHHATGDVESAMDKVSDEDIGALDLGNESGALATAMDDLSDATFDSVVGTADKAAMTAADTLLNEDFMNEESGDTMSDDLDASLELSDLMGELDGLLDEDDDSKK